MKRLYSTLLDFFGFNKAESNGFIVLIVLILLTGILPRIYFQTNEEPLENTDSLIFAEWIKDVENSITATKEAAPSIDVVVDKEVKLFTFDPNSATKNELSQLGMSDFSINNLIKYRESGGFFAQKSDLKKIYGIEESLMNKLWDFIKIEIPANKMEPEEYSSSIVNVKPFTIDLNKANPSELMQLKGIGNTYANRIVKYRELLGGFYSVSQLKEVYGFKEELLAEIKPYVFVETGRTLQLNINSDSIKYLVKHPYIDYSMANALINYRKNHGNYTMVDDVLKIQLINDSIFNRIKPYISVN